MMTRPTAMFTTAEIRVIDRAAERWAEAYPHASKLLATGSGNNIFRGPTADDVLTEAGIDLEYERGDVHYAQVFGAVCERGREIVNRRFRMGYRQLTPHLLRTAIRLYQDGAPVEVVSARVGVHRSTIWRALKRAGVEMRPRGTE